MTELLRFEEVSKMYQSGPVTIYALRKTTFSAKAGELVAIVGPSGSGKSTFLSLAGALLKPTNGKIIINGQNISQFSQKEQVNLRLHEIGFIFQAAHLIDYLKVKEQISFIGNLANKDRKMVEQKTLALLKQLGMKDRANFYPRDLSGGEKQRVAIARALINSPSIVLADEPTASLDFKRSREVVELILKEITTINRAAIMVTHDERILDFCHHIYRMEDGLLTKES